MSDIISGFLPVSDANSRVLILGSFPSVKSRAVSFYYGNRQNRFWKILSEFFGEAIEEAADFRRSFVLAHGVALWDIVTECEIVGSSDASIKNYKIAPIDELLRGAQASVRASHFGLVRLRSLGIRSLSAGLDLVPCTDLRPEHPSCRHHRYPSWPSST